MEKKERKSKENEQRRGKNDKAQTSGGDLWSDRKRHTGKRVKKRRETN